LIGSRVPRYNRDMTESLSRHEHLVEVYRIVEMRDDAVYKTEFVERRWVLLDERPPEGYQFANIPTKWLEENDFPQTIRRRKT
jgi:hypothetical protein